MDTTREADLIAWLIGDREPTRELREWLETRRGRHELQAYRKTVGSLDLLYLRVQGKRGSTVVHFDHVESPVGAIFLAASDAGLVRVSFAGSLGAFRRDLAARLGGAPALVRAPERVADAGRQLREYFAGRRQSFDLPADLSTLTPFQKSVLEAAQRIPCGKTSTYGEIARRIGKPAASRAVGQALGRNPVPIVIPCHRVLAAGGAIGGYTGGLAIKRTLLELEARR